MEEATLKAVEGELESSKLSREKDFQPARTASWSGEMIIMMVLMILKMINMMTKKDLREGCKKMSLLVEF